MATISVDISGIVDGTGIDASDVTLPLADLKTAIENVLNGVQAFDQLNVGTSSEVTISSGAISISKTRHRVDTEGNAATDLLDTINGGAEGDVLELSLENAGRLVTVRHNAGNIWLAAAVDINLTSVYQTLRLRYTGTKWVDATEAVTAANVAPGQFARGNYSFQQPVGFGTASPIYPVDIQSGSNARLQIKLTATGGVGWNLISANNALFSVPDGTLMFYDGGDTVMALDSTNNRVGVGTTSPAERLHVEGGARVTGDLDHDGSNVGFYGSAPVAKATVTGSRASNAALASLLTALANLGLITNSTT